MFYVFCFCLVTKYRFVGCYKNDVWKWLRAGKVLFIKYNPKKLAVLFNQISCRHWIKKWLGTISWINAECFDGSHHKETNFSEIFFVQNLFIFIEIHLFSLYDYVNTSWKLCLFCHLIIDLCRAHSLCLKLRT